MAVELLGSPCRAARRLTHYGGADPQDFILEGRLGSGDWVTLYDTTGFDFASVGEKKQFDIPRVAVTAATVQAAQGRLSTLNLLHSESILYGASV